jgi:hypothetical protein
MTEEKFDKYIDMSLGDMIGMSKKFMYCPNPKGCEFAFDPTNMKEITCPFCKLRWCLLCKEEWHGTWTCTEAKG